VTKKGLIPSCSSKVVDRGTLEDKEDKEDKGDKGERKYYV
jgi:hypothetical protein